MLQRVPAMKWVSSQHAAHSPCGWSVGDEPASRFVDAFYDELADGSTISRAARAGRAAASAAGDASALAYAVYAHPDARVRVE